MLFHVSEDNSITRFDPRPSPSSETPAVWAVDDEHLRNYLLPRDCPRVTFCALPSTTGADRELLRGRRVVVAVEAGWMDRIRACRLFAYRLPPESFVQADENAGCFVSRTAVTPRGMVVFDDVLAELAARGVEVRVLANLWELSDTVARSTLRFSIIRMRNAQPRPELPELMTGGN